MSGGNATQPYPLAWQRRLIPLRFEIGVNISRRVGGAGKHRNSSSNGARNADRFIFVYWICDEQLAGASRKQEKIGANAKKREFISSGWPTIGQAKSARLSQVLPSIPEPLKSIVVRGSARPPLVGIVPLAQLVEQPRSRVRPVAIGRGPGNPQQLPGLLHGKSREKSQFHEFSLQLVLVL